MSSDPSDSPEVEEIMRALFDARSQSPTPVTDEAWEKNKRLFRTSQRVLREDALRIIEDEEYYT